MVPISFFNTWSEGNVLNSTPMLMQINIIRISASIFSADRLVEIFPVLNDLYKARWNIGVFFRQIKQTLHLGDFLGHSRKAIEWQIWTALLMYLLLRFLHACGDWTHSFARLFTALRAVLWQRRDLLEYVRSYGTAGGTFRLQWAPQQAFFPGFG